MKAFWLGIETSCDDTSCGLVSENGEVLWEKRLSQDVYHQPFQGVVPEIASRWHLDHLFHLLTEVEPYLRSGGWQGIAVSNRPGLVGSLLVGVSVAQALGWVARKPVMGVNHVKAHMASLFLNDGTLRPVSPQERGLILVASGGHSHLFEWRGLESRPRLLVPCRDDAAGEVLDKLGVKVGVGFPAGAVWDQQALNHPQKNQGTLVRFWPQHTHFYSFSGLKSAFLRFWAQEPGVPLADRALQVMSHVLVWLMLPVLEKLNQEKYDFVGFCGGVSASQFWRWIVYESDWDWFWQRPGGDVLRSLAQKGKVIFPPARWSTDNGAMVALAGFWEQKWQSKPVPVLDVLPESELQDWS